MINLSRMNRSPVRIGNLKERERWRLWHATDFKSLIYPNILISLIIGYFPIEYKSGKWIFSKKLFAYSTAIVFSLVASLLRMGYKTNTSGQKYHTTTQTVYINFLLFLNIFTILLMYALSHQRFLVLQMVSKASDILLEEDFDNMAKFIHNKDIIFSVIVPVHIVLAYWKMSPNFLEYGTMLFTFMTVQVMDMFYVNCVHVLGTCFKRINESLKQLSRPLKQLQEKSQLRGEGILRLMEVKHYEQLHQQISDVIEFLNKTYTTTIIIMTIATFVTVTLNMYFSFEWLASEDISDYKRGVQIRHVKVFAYGLHHMTKFILIVWVCQTAMDRAQEIGTTIHDVLTECTHSVVRRELSYFALQVVHRDVKFTTRAFTLNAKFLSQFVGGILIYITILFQFLLSSTCNYD